MSGSVTASMWFGSFAICFLLVNVNAASKDFMHREATAPHLQRDHQSFHPYHRKHQKPRGAQSTQLIQHDNSVREKVLEKVFHWHEKPWLLKDAIMKYVRTPTPVSQFIQEVESDRENTSHSGESTSQNQKSWLLNEAQTVYHKIAKPVTNAKDFLVLNQNEIVVSAVIWLVFIFVVAFFYKRSPKYNLDTGSNAHAAVDPVELASWRSEWYQCHHYPEIFFWSCCCPCIRWAHTMDLLQFLDYWPAFVVFFLFVAMNQLTGFFLFSILLTAALVFYRQKTRKHFGMENYATCTGVTTDCVGYCFCSPCFIAQEAYHVTQAAKLGWTKELADKSEPFSGRLKPSASQES